MKNRGLAKIPIAMNGIKVKLRRKKDIELDLNNSRYMVKIWRLIIASYDVFLVGPYFCLTKCNDCFFGISITQNVFNVITFMIDNNDLE